MLRFFLKGFAPMDEKNFLKSNRVQKETIVYDDDIRLTGKDMMALYIAAMQVFFPIVLGFGVAYFLAIYLMTEVWLG